MRSKEVLEVLTDLLRSWAGECAGGLLSSRAAEAAVPRGEIAGAYLPPHLGEGGESRGEQTHKPVHYQESQFAFQP